MRHPKIAVELLWAVLSGVKWEFMQATGFNFLRFCAYPRLCDLWVSVKLPKSSILFKVASFYCCCRLSAGGAQTRAELGNGDGLFSRLYIIRWIINCRLIANPNQSSITALSTVLLQCNVVRTWPSDFNLLLVWAGRDLTFGTQITCVIVQVKNLPRLYI